MKKVLFAAIAVFAFTLTNAQSNLKGMMHANAMAGILTGTASSSDDLIASYKSTVTGSNFGAQFQYAIEDSFSVGIGLESNTVKLRVRDYSANINDHTLNIVKVCLAGRYYLLNIEKVNIFVGPTVGYAFGRDNGNGNANVFVPTQQQDSRTRYSGLNYGLNAGGNYYFTDSLGIILQFSYESSSLSSSRSQTGTADVNGKTTISGLNIMGGLAFKF